MASEAVYEFLKEHNRPFSLNDILASVGKSEGKAAVQKALDKLVHKDKVFEKTYGKQRVYCIVQDKTVDTKNMDGELRRLDQEIYALTTNLTSLQEKLQLDTIDLKSLQNKMSTEEASIEREKLLAETATLKAKLSNLKENAEPISDKEKAKIKSENENCTKEYRKRKRLCTDIINSILEGYPKTKKHLLEDIGIETDEDVNFKLE